LSWATGTGISYYHVKRSTIRGGPYYSVVGSSKTNNYTDTGLTNGTTYYYVVSALDSSGSEGPNSNEVPAQPYVPTLAPPAPTGLQAAGTGFSIQLSWTASPNATSYRVERALFEDGPWNSAGKSATVTYEDVNVLYGVTYYYRVMALNYIGEGDPSEVASARP
jgi:cellulose 1,4-beta-cellobiosidase